MTNGKRVEIQNCNKFMHCLSCEESYEYCKDHFEKYEYK